MTLCHFTLARRLAAACRAFNETILVSALSQAGFKNVTRLNNNNNTCVLYNNVNSEYDGNYLNQSISNNCELFCNVTQHHDSIGGEVEDGQVEDVNPICPPKNSSKATLQSSCTTTASESSYQPSPSSRRIRVFIPDVVSNMDDSCTKQNRVNEYIEKCLDRSRVPIVISDTFVGFQEAFDKKTCPVAIFQIVHTNEGLSCIFNCAFYTGAKVLCAEMMTLESPITRLSESENSDDGEGGKRSKPKRTNSVAIAKLPVLSLLDIAEYLCVDKLCIGLDTAGDKFGDYMRMLLCIGFSLCTTLGQNGARKGKIAVVEYISKNIQTGENVFDVNLEKQSSRVSQSNEFSETGSDYGSEYGSEGEKSQRNSSNQGEHTSEEIATCFAEDEIDPRGRGYGELRYE